MKEECVSKNTEQLGYDSIDSVMQMLREVVLTMLDEGVNVNNILKYMGIEYCTVVRSLLEQQNARWYKDPDQESMDLEIDHITLSSGQTLHVAITDDGGVK